VIRDHRTNPAGLQPLRDVQKKRKIQFTERLIATTMPDHYFCTSTFERDYIERPRQIPHARVDRKVFSGASN
jgi:hypothetical protein